MRRISSVSIFAILLTICNASLAQLHHFGRSSNYFYNPAYTGMYNAHSVTLLGSPFACDVPDYRNLSGMYEGNIGKSNSVGVSYLYNQTALSKSNMVSLFYSYSFAINDDVSIRLGISPTFDFRKIDNLYLYGDDPIFMPGSAKVNTFFLNTGAALKIKKFDFGFSVNSATLYRSNGLYQYHPSCVMMSSYQWDIYENLTMTPNLQLFLPANEYVSISLSDYFRIYRIFLLGGTIWHTSSSTKLGASCGLLLNEKFQLLFAYDRYNSTFDINEYSALIRYVIK